MSIELRSTHGITNALVALHAGEYLADKELAIRLDDQLFFNGPPPGTEDTINLIMTAVGNLPNVQKLTLCPIENTHTVSRKCRFPARSLAIAIAFAEGLEELSIENLVLTGKPPEATEHIDFNENGPNTFGYLAGALEATQLKTFTMKRVRSELIYEENDNGEDDADDAADSIYDPLDVVIRAAAQMGCLEQLVLTGGYNFNVKSLSPETTLALSHVRGLKKVSIHSHELLNNNLESMADFLRTKPHLEEFNFTCRLGRKGSEAIMAILKACSLPKLRIYVESFEAPNERDQVIQQIADAVGQSSLQLFQFNFPGIQEEPEVVEVFTKMLRHNYSLEQMYLWPSGAASWHRSDEIDFLLKTNKMGRGELFQDNQNTKMSWNKLVDSTEGILDNIFYLAQSHPAEFSAFGLRDCSEKLPLTIGTMKLMLEDVVAPIRKSIESMADQTKKLVDSQDEMRSDLASMSETYQSAIAKSTQAIQQSTKSLLSKHASVVTATKTNETLFTQHHEAVASATNNIAQSLLSQAEDSMVAALRSYLDESHNQLAKLIITSIQAMENKITSSIGGLKCNFDGSISELIAAQGSTAIAEAKTAEEVNRARKEEIQSMLDSQKDSLTVAIDTAVKVQAEKYTKLMEKQAEEHANRLQEQAKNHDERMQELTKRMQQQAQDHAMIMQKLTVEYGAKIEKFEALSWT